MRTLKLIAMAVMAVTATGCFGDGFDPWINGARVCATAIRNGQPSDGPAQIRLRVTNEENGSAFDQSWAVEFGTDGPGRTCMSIDLGETAGTLTSLQPEHLSARKGGSGGLLGGGERITGPRLAESPRQTPEAYMTGMPRVEVIFNFDESVPTEIYDLGLLGSLMERLQKGLQDPRRAGEDLRYAELTVTEGIRNPYTENAGTGARIEKVSGSRAI